MNTLNAESDCKLDKLKTLGVFLLFGVQKQDRKVESRPTTHFTETCFLDVLDLLITANAFLISLLCVFANEQLERRK